jgi:hypothetical protein
VGGWHYLRLDRANALAVKYGAANSKGEASLADRCVGVMREAYQTTNDPGKAGDHLARAGQVTRWHRCVAMAYGGLDAQPSKAGLPPRDQFQRAVRSLCTVAIQRGLIPLSGAPQPNTPEWDAFQQLLAQRILGASSGG